MAQNRFVVELREASTVGLAITVTEQPYENHQRTVRVNFYGQVKEITGASLYEIKQKAGDEFRIRGRRFFFTDNKGEYLEDPMNCESGVLYINVAEGARGGSIRRTRNTVRWHTGLRERRRGIKRRYRGVGEILGEMLKTFLD